MRFPEGLELKSYGQQLLDGRQAKGWSQKQLSKKLFLPVHFIRALEAGEHGMLPEIPYVMSIYRKVAVAVGVDPEPMIQDCKAYLEREGQSPIHPLQPQAGGKPVQGQEVSSSESRRESYAPSQREAMAAQQRKRQANRSKGDGMIILVGCGVGLALVAAALFNNELRLAIRSRLIPSNAEVDQVDGGVETQNQVPGAVATQPQPIPNIPDTPGTPLVSPPEGPFEQPELGSGGPAAGTVRFFFTSNAVDERSSWIRVENARGATLFEGIPEPFTSVDLPVTAGVRVRVGRPDLVRWQQPGQPPQSLPESQLNGLIELIPGPVAEQVIPAPPDALPLDTPLLDPAAPAPDAAPAPAAP